MFIKCGGKRPYFLDNNLNLKFEKMEVKFQKWHFYVRWDGQTQEIEFSREYFLLVAVNER